MREGFGGSSNDEDDEQLMVKERDGFLVFFFAEKDKEVSLRVAAELNAIAETTAFCG